MGKKENSKVCFDFQDKIEYTYSKTEYNRYSGREYIKQCIVNRKTIVLLSGWTGSGKDYVGDIIEKEYGYRKDKIAKSLKDEVSNKYNISRKLLETQEGKRTVFENGETYRDLLIRHGEEMREKDKYYWVKNIVSEEYGESSTSIVISDWRFIEEYEYLENTGSNIITIRIERFDEINTECKTEHALDNFEFDYKISNSLGTTREEIIERLQYCKIL
jgi:phosphomevalonate kinase